MTPSHPLFQALTRDELLIIVDRFTIAVPDRRGKAGIIGAVAGVKPSRLTEVLEELPRERLKDLCRELHLDDSGREKSVLVGRLVAEKKGAKVRQAPEPKPSAVPASNALKAETRGSIPPPSGAGGAIVGFESTLWQAADKLRNNMDAAEYKHVVLGLIFLKYISDAFEEKRLALEADKKSGADPEDRDEYRAENIFWVPKEARWPELQGNAKQPKIGKLLDDAMVAIESDNPSLKGVLPKDYARPALDKQRLGELIDLIGTIGLGDKQNRSRDVLGRVYEYFLTRFASAEGKNGGQFYTPQCVVRVLVEMLAPYKGRVFDACCGSGGMFVSSEKFVEHHGGRIGLWLGLAARCAEQTRTLSEIRDFLLPRLLSGDVSVVSHESIAESLA